MPEVTRVTFEPRWDVIPQFLHYVLTSHLALAATGLRGDEWVWIVESRGPLPLDHTPSPILVPLRGPSTDDW